MPYSVVDLISELEDPRCYPDGVTSVHIVQTHLSVVCITDETVYKLKKAVELPFVDFSTLAQRQKACADEVRLNRRLCPKTYLGTAALRRVDGQLHFGELDASGDDDLDVAVVMQRLPQEQMLDERIARGSATVDEIERLAEAVAAFHARAERSEQITTTGHPDRLAGFAADNFDELADIADAGLPTALRDAVREASSRGFARILPTMRDRAARGCVVDGHGDLHARNICMTEPPAIYDCIEFQPSFRCGDVATEVAFLAMDLRYRRELQLERHFVDAYVRHSEDRELPGLLPVLCSYRAMVRGKVSALAAGEQELSHDDREHARTSARDHLSLAAHHLLATVQPTWLVVCGPPASGKSRLARAFVERGGWPYFATDEVRKQLAGIAPDEPAAPEHYRAAFSDRTYTEVHRRAAAATAEGRAVVVLDGNYATRERRAEALAAAQRAGATVRLVCVEVDVETAVRRATARAAEPGHVSDADADVTRELHARFATPDDAEARLVRLDGTRATRELENDVTAFALA